MTLARDGLSLNRRIPAKKWKWQACLKESEDFFNEKVQKIKLYKEEREMI